MLKQSIDVILDKAMLRMGEKTCKMCEEMARGEYAFLCYHVAWLEIPKKHAIAEKQRGVYPPINKK